MYEREEHKRVAEKYQHQVEVRYVLKAIAM